MKNILLSIIIILLSSLFCNKIDSNPMYVSNPDGAKIYSQPDINSKILGNANIGEKVLQLKEDNNEHFINGEYGKWAFIKFNSINGWIFNSLLRKYDITELKKTASQYYNNFYKDIYQKTYGTTKSNYPFFYNEITNQTDKTISIVKVLGDFVLLSHKSQNALAEDLGQSESLWRFDGSKWHEYIKFDSKNIKPSLLHINNDKYPDYYYFNGCCDSYTLYVYFGESLNSMKQILSSQCDEGPDSHKNSVSKCSFNIYCGTSDGSYLINHDCKTNKFIKSLQKNTSPETSEAASHN